MFNIVLTTVYISALINDKNIGKEGIVRIGIHGHVLVLMWASSVTFENGCRDLAEKSV